MKGNEIIVMSNKNLYILSPRLGTVTLDYNADVNAQGC